MHFFSKKKWMILSRKDPVDNGRIWGFLPIQSYGPISSIFWEGFLGFLGQVWIEETPKPQPYWLAGPMTARDV